MEGVSRDPYHTLFVARLSFETKEEQIKEVFGKYGRIEYVKVVKDHEV